MAHRLTAVKAEAVKLRLKGNSYSQIKTKLGISKSTLSGWLKNYPLSIKRINKLKYSEAKIEKFKNTMKAKKEARLLSVYEKEKSNLLPLSRRELYLAGLFLYWGEGSKTTPYSTILSNSNPQIIKFFVFWIIKILGIPKNKLRTKVHIYQDMDEQQEVTFWSKLTGIPSNQFNKTYIKKTTLAGLTYKGFNHGTCNIMAHDRDTAEKIIMGIKAISDNIGGTMG